MIFDCCVDTEYNTHNVIYILGEAPGTSRRAALTQEGKRKAQLWAITN